MCTLCVVGHWIGWNQASQRELCKQQMKQSLSALRLHSCCAADCGFRKLIHYITEWRRKHGNAGCWHARETFPLQILVGSLVMSCGVANVMNVQT